MARSAGNSQSGNHAVKRRLTKPQKPRYVHGWRACSNDHGCFSASPKFSEEASKCLQKFDGITPYGVHPTFMAMMILQEGTMEENDRVRRAKALLGHDLLEDTTAPLPGWCKDLEVLALIDGLTFTNDQDPLAEMWNRGDEVILVKFYDNVANLMNTRMMTSERREQRRQHVLEHLAWVESRNPQLEIVKIAKGLLGLVPP